MGTIGIIVLSIFVSAVVLSIYDESQKRKEDFFIQVDDVLGPKWIKIDYRINKGSSLNSIKEYSEDTNQLYTKFFNTVREANDFASQFKTRAELIRYIELENQKVVKPYTNQ